MISALSSKSVKFQCFTNALRIDRSSISDGPRNCSYEQRKRKFRGDESVCCPLRTIVTLTVPLYYYKRKKNIFIIYIYIVYI